MKVEIKDEYDHMHTDEIVCPYCGEKHSDSWECSDYDDDFECGECGKHFIMERIIDVTYTTRKKD